MEALGNSAKTQGIAIYIASDGSSMLAAMDVAKHGATKARPASNSSAWSFGVIVVLIRVLLYAKAGAGALLITSNCMLS